MDGEIDQELDEKLDEYDGDDGHRNKALQCNGDDGDEVFDRESLRE